MTLTKFWATILAGGVLLTLTACAFLESAPAGDAPAATTAPSGAASGATTTPASGATAAPAGDAASGNVGNAGAAAPTPTDALTPTPTTASATAPAGDTSAAPADATAMPAPTPTPLPTAAAGANAGADGIKQWREPPPRIIDPEASYSAVINTSAGSITVELLSGEAPATVNNFVFLAREGFYDGVIFHRTIPGFMIQGGDPTGTGAGGPGYRFADEQVQRPYIRGVMAMANAGPNTNGSQFFLMHADYPLPPNYTIFGQAVSGLETIDAIATAPTKPGGEGSSPVTPAVIQSVEIIGP